MTIYQAKFTPTGGDDIDIMIFPYQGKFETVPYYRQTENQGLDGNYAIKLGSKSQIINTNIIVESAFESDILDARGLSGILIVRETSFSEVKLLTATRIRGLNPTTTLNAGIIENVYDYVEIETEWIKEPPI